MAPVESDSQMQVDPQHLLNDGYIVLRQVVPPDQLHALRLSIEVLVDREKARSRARRREDEGIGGSWYASAQPRFEMDELVCPETANAIEFALSETTLGVSRQLLRAPETALCLMQALCSGIVDYGSTDWHRDVSALDHAPLSGLQSDLQDNMPGYVQWNIPLYDDDVLWVVPGSHRRPDNEAERRQLLLDPRVSLPDGIPVELEAGDGVVYTSIITHWGSYYSSRMRRTIHLGYRSFGGEIFPYFHRLLYDEGLDFARHLSPAARRQFEGFVASYRGEREKIEVVFRTILAKDESGFCARLGELHPGSKNRMVAVVLLSRLANKIALLHQPEAERSEEDRSWAQVVGRHSALYEALAGRFSAEEAVALQQRFAGLVARLLADDAACRQQTAALHAELKPATEPPDFRSRSLRNLHSEMPDFSVDDFIRSWDS